MSVLKIYYFLPLLLISGPFLSDALISISSIFFLIYFIYFQKIKFKNNIFVFLLIIYLYFIFTSILSVDILWSLKSILPFFRFFMMGLIIFYLLEKKIIKLEMIYYIICFTIFFLFIDAIFQFREGENLFGLKYSTPYRVTSLFGDEAVLGGFVFKMLILCYFINSVITIKYQQNIFFILNILSFTIILISGDRSAFFLSIIYMIFLLPQFRLNKNFVLIPFFAFSIFFILISNFDILKNRTIFMTVEGFFNSLEKFDHDKITSKMDYTLEKKNDFYYISEAHHRHMLGSFDIIKQYPLFGSGPNTFRIVCKNDPIGTCTTHPHNIYLQLFSETGIFGFLFVSIIFFRSLFYILLNMFKQNSSLQVYLINLNILILLFPLAPSGNFFNNWNSILNFLPFGFYLYYFKDNLVELRKKTL
tara:strand:+ start:512 stop:1765 length:1254 start_codon:yes stop_codon:yes gene_type:complete